MSRKTGMGSFQKYKMLVLPDGKGRKLVPRDFGNPDDIVMLAITHREVINQYGVKKHREWYIKKSPNYRQKVVAKNG